MNKINSKILFDDAKTLFNNIKDRLHPKTKNKYNDLIIFNSTSSNRNLNSLKKLNRELLIFNDIKQTKKLTIKNLVEKKRETTTENLPTAEYFVTGGINKVLTYLNLNKKNIKRRNVVNARVDKTEVIKATSKSHAEKLFKAEMVKMHQAMIIDSDKVINQKLIDIFIDDITPINSYNAIKTEDIFMRDVKHHKSYSFIPADDKLCKNENMCVPDQFIATYGPLIKKLNYDYFILLCERVYNQINFKLDIVHANNSLDKGVNDNDVEQWEITDGVTPKMLMMICEILDISHYAYDITKQCFLKHISKNRHYPALVYYAVSNHMYYVSNYADALSLICKAKNPEVKMRSLCLVEEVKETENIYATQQIYEDIPISDFERLDLHDCIIMYSNYMQQNDDMTIDYARTSLNFQLDEIIRIYGEIPEITNDK